MRVLTNVMLDYKITIELVIMCSNKGIYWIWKLGLNCNCCLLNSFIGQHLYLLMHDARIVFLSNNLKFSRENDNEKEKKYLLIFVVMEYIYVVQ